MYSRLSILNLTLYSVVVMAGISTVHGAEPARFGPANWVREPDAPWQPRDSQAECVFRDRMWVMGGWFNSFEAPPRDIWSTRDGQSWVKQPVASPWQHTDLAMAVAFQDRLWVMGGWYNGRLPGHSASHQVWSTHDGEQWTQVTPHAGWSPRLAAAVVAWKGRLWLLGGTENYYFGDAQSLKNDVWSSADGETWQQETAAAPWPPRAYHQAVVLDDRLYLMGGGNYVPTYQAYSDVWSTHDGVHWQCETPQAPWHPRLWFSAAVYRDRMWVLGGWSHENWNDVWYLSNGQSWYPLNSDRAWTARHEHSAFVFQDKLWIAGGHAAPLSSEVWSLHLPQP